MKRYLLPALLAGLAGAAWADPGMVIRDTELRATPNTDAAVVQPLAAQTAVDVGQRQGGWYKVKVAGKEGWVRMSVLRLGDGSVAKSGGDSGLGSALNFLTTGRSGSSGVTVATGVRGLDGASIANATPNHAAVDGMDKVAVSAGDARKFADQAKLKARSVAYLPESSGSHSGGGGSSSGNAFPQGDY